MNHTYVDRLRSMLKEKSVYVIGGCLLGGFIYIVYRTANKKTKERITHKPHAFSNASVPKSSSNIETI